MRLLPVCTVPLLASLSLKARVCRSARPQSPTLTRNAAWHVSRFDYLRVPPRQQRSFSTLLKLIVALHLATCATWFVRVLFVPRARVYEFLDEMSARHASPIDLYSAQGKTEAYVLCSYFVMTVVFPQMDALVLLLLSPLCNVLLTHLAATCASYVKRHSPPNCSDVVNT